MLFDSFCSEQISFIVTKRVRTIVTNSFLHLANVYMKIYAYRKTAPLIIMLSSVLPQFNMYNLKARDVKYILFIVSL